MEDIQEKVEEKRKAGYIDVWAAFEVVATSQEVSKNAMEKHLNSLARAPGVLVYEQKVEETKQIDPRPFKVEQAFSTVAEAKFLVKDLPTLVNVCLAYAPSAIEILAPKELKVKIEEVQDIANLLAGLMHRFAAQGIGGIVIKT